MNHLAELKKEKLAAVSRAARSLAFPKGSANSNSHKPRCICWAMARERPCPMHGRFTRMQTLMLHNEGKLN